MSSNLYSPAPEQVKISNLMRVLGEEATMDPTAIEQQVRQQMEERSQVRERPCSTSQRVTVHRVALQSTCTDTRLYLHLQQFLRGPV